MSSGLDGSDAGCGPRGWCQGFSGRRATGGTGAATGGAGCAPTAKLEPHVPQNFWSAAVRGVPHVGQNPNPVDIMMRPFESTPGNWLRPGRSEGGNQVFAAEPSVLDRNSLAPVQAGK